MHAEVYRYRGKMVQDDAKVEQTVSDTFCVCQRINYSEIRNKKTVLEAFIALSDARIYSFPHLRCNPVKIFFSDRKQFTTRDIFICLAQENREMYPKIR
jgi:hypothetical protein